MVKPTTKKDEDTLHSSSSDPKPKKPLKKRPKPKKQKPGKKHLALRKRDQSEKKTLNCEAHQQPVQFICTNNFCFQELCGYCILNHKEHIQYIQGIAKILEDYAKDNTSKELFSNPQKLMNEINTNQKVQTKVLDDLSNQMMEVITTKIENLKQEIVNSSTSALNIVENMQTFKTKANEIMNNKLPIDRSNLDVIKKYLQFSNNIHTSMGGGRREEGGGRREEGGMASRMARQEKPFNISFNINTKYLLNQLNDAIDQNLTLNVDGYNLESTLSGQPKLLHWFEWGKKKLNVYDLITNTTLSIELDINFKIPSFSRSIIIPNGEIYLLGGEEPEYFSRREVYMLDIKLPEKKLFQKSSMLHKKFDFTLCYLKGKNFFVFIKLKKCVLSFKKFNFF